MEQRLAGIEESRGKTKLFTLHKGFLIFFSHCLVKRSSIDDQPVSALIKKCEQMLLKKIQLTDALWDNLTKRKVVSEKTRAIIEASKTRRAEAETFHFTFHQQMKSSVKQVSALLIRIKTCKKYDGLCESLILDNQTKAAQILLDAKNAKIHRCSLPPQDTQCICDNGRPLGKKRK
jgi:hypothetical protein